MTEADNTITGGRTLLEMLQNAQSNITQIFNAALMLLGMAVLVFAAITFVKNLKNSQQAQWGIFFLAFIAGGFMATSGFNGLQSLSSGASQTIEDLTGNGGQTIVIEGEMPSVNIEL